MPSTRANHLTMRAKLPRTSLPATAAAQARARMGLGHIRSPLLSGSSSSTTPTHLHFPKIQYDAKGNRGHHVRPQTLTHAVPVEAAFAAASVAAPAASAAA